MTAAIRSKGRLPYLLLLAAAAFSQMTRSASTTGALHPSQPRAGISGTIRGKPLHAKFQIIGTPQSTDDRLWISEIWRNRLGSVRTDVANHSFSWISDVGGQRFIVIDHASKIAVIAPERMEDSHSMWGFNAKPTLTTESATILGVTCSKVILSDGESGMTNAGELWTANGLGIVMKDIKPVPGGTIVWIASSIEETEPAASVFEIPQGYKAAAP